VSGNLTQLLEVVDGADRAPTTQARAAATSALRQLEELLARLE
jgi:hypothetical protein